MNKIKRKSTLVILLTIIWCILNERFNITTAFIGFGVSLITIQVLRFVEQKENDTYTYSISVWRLCFFFLLLIKNIYVSAFTTIKHLIKKEINPQFIGTTTTIKRVWLQSLIGNAVTLTPGTVTVHMDEDSYTILWLYPLTIRQKDIKKYLIADFEKALTPADNEEEF